MINNTLNRLNNKQSKLLWLILNLKYSNFELI
jgi:hypothetical protein